MNFEKISAVNVARARRWHPGGIKDWSPADWGCATGGEAGEVCNAIKKLARAREKLKQAEGPQTVAEAVRQVGLELGDTYLYLNLTAVRLGFTLADCVEGLDMPQLDPQSLGLVPVSVLGLNLMADVGKLCQSISLSTVKQMSPDYLKLEMGMVFYSLQAIAHNLGLDLETCVVETFNRVSEREGFPERMDLVELRMAA